MGLPIIREADGLALSSRNVFLSDDARRSALALSSALFAAADLVEQGERDSAAVVSTTREVMETEPGIDVEYAEIAEQRNVAPMTALDRPAFLAVAGRVGDVRLIDNLHLDFDGDVVAVDRGTRLEAPSVLYGAGPDGEEESP